MTPEEYWAAVELFAQLQDIAVDERQAALDAACEGNPALRAQVLRLLDADSHASGGSFLGRPAIEDAAQLASAEEVQYSVQGRCWETTFWASASERAEWASSTKLRTCA